MEVGREKDSLPHNLLSTKDVIVKIVSYIFLLSNLQLVEIYNRFFHGDTIYKSQVKVRVLKPNQFEYVENNNLSVFIVYLFTLLNFFTQLIPTPHATTCFEWCELAPDLL